MAKIITEDMIEQAAIELFTTEHEGIYTALNCYTSKPETLPDNSGRANKKQVVLPEVVLQSLLKLNPQIPASKIKQEVDELCRNRYGDALKDNYERYNQIRNGIKVKFKRDGKEEQEILRLVDFATPESNSFVVASQMWIRGEVHWRRPDLMIFVNGLPLVFIELKNSNINVKNAYDKNLTDYRRDIPWLFNYNQICVLSNGMETRLGSFSAGYEHFFEWLKIESERESPDRANIRESCISLEYFIRGLAKPAVLLDYIENFVLFDNRKGGNVHAKIIAKNHQFHGVNNAFAAFEKRQQLQGRLGVFWHTQGSGKSYSMVMLARKIKHKVAGNFTFLIVTDRDDLDGQIYKTFLRSGFMGAEEKVQPASGLNLRKELTGNKAILFTLIHKFRYEKGQEYPVLSERSDIIVFVDEAHRTQYKELAENMRKGLPNAQYLAFTGTPLLGSKNLTASWFANVQPGGKPEDGYVSVYNFAESVADGATVPLFYVQRVPEVLLNNKFLNEDFCEILEDEDLSEAEQKRLENSYSQELEVIKRDDVLEVVAQNIAYHFPRRGFRGKGMVIAVDKFTAVKLYDKVQYHWKEGIKRLNGEIAKEEDEAEKLRLKAVVDYMRKVEMAVVISEGADEAEKFRGAGLQIALHRERMNKVDENGADVEDNFKDADHPLSLVFVCAMWLTGFDAPSVSTLYLHKPMRGHTLMQTIARANRVFPGKENGIIVDYLDVFKYLKRALADYATNEDGTMPVKEIEKLLAQLHEAIEMTFAFCHQQGFDLSTVIAETETFKNLELFADYANIIVGNDEVCNEFRVLTNTVANLYESLRPDIFKMDFDPKPKEAVLYLRDVVDGKIRPEKLAQARERISTLLDQSVAVAESAEVYLQEEEGKEIDISKIDVELLREKLKKSRNKNLAIVDLRQAIEKKLAQMLKKNVTRSNFAERYQGIIDAYNAGGSQNTEYYERLLEIMQELREEEERHIREGISEEELEIFDLLCKERLTQEEEKRVKLAARTLYKVLCDKKRELFVVGWYNDQQPKERVKSVIIETLNHTLPESYDRDLFSHKSNMVFEHIVDQAIMGFGWVA